MSLVMQRGFFDDPRIRIIRKYGDRYVLIFMMLVGFSENDLPNSGLYLPNGLSIFEEDLPALLGVDEKTVSEALMLFESLDMFERDEKGVMYVNYSGLFHEKAA